MNNWMWKVYCSIYFKQLTPKCKTCGMGSDNSNMSSDLTVVWHSETYLLYATTMVPVIQLLPSFSLCCLASSDQYSIIYWHLAKLLAFTYEVLTCLTVPGLFHLISSSNSITNDFIFISIASMQTSRHTVFIHPFNHLWTSELCTFSLLWIMFNKHGTWECRTSLL